MIEIQKVSEDARGKLYVLASDGDEFAHLATIKAGASRGGHFHDGDEEIIVLDGELEYFLMDTKKNKETKGTIGKGKNLNVKASIAHLLIAKTDSLIIGIIKKSETTNYQPYRKTVEEFLAKNNK